MKSIVRSEGLPQKRKRHESSSQGEMENKRQNFDNCQSNAGNFFVPANAADSESLDNILERAWANYCAFNKINPLGQENRLLKNFYFYKYRFERTCREKDQLRSEIQKLAKIQKDLEHKNSKEKENTLKVMHEVLDEKDNENSKLKQTIANGLEKLKLEKSKVEEYERYREDLTDILAIPNATFSKIIDEVKDVKKINEELINHQEKMLKELDAKDQHIAEILEISENPTVRNLVYNNEKLKDDIQKKKLEIEKVTNELQECQMKLTYLRGKDVPIIPCDHSKFHSEILELKEANKELAKNNTHETNADQKQMQLEIEIEKLNKNIFEKEEKFKELNEIIEQGNQKLSIQRAKCEQYEMQQNKLFDLFQDIPPNDQRNFLGLQENIENLKQDYIKEKERADNLATNMLDTPAICDHSKLDEEILRLKERNTKLKQAINILAE